MNEIKTPRIRFKGFTDDWEQRKLGDITEYIKGFAFKTKDYRKSGHRIIRVSDLGKDSIINTNDSIFVDDEISKLQDKYKINENEIIITTVGSRAELKESAVGRPIIVRNSLGYLLNQNLVKIHGKNNKDSCFIYYQLLQPRYSQYIATIQRGNANQANIAISDLWKYGVFITKHDEQKKIGDFFNHIDTLITLHQREYEKLQIIKKSMLENCFPKNGEKVPRIRFAGFTGDWEQRKLGDIVSITMGQSPNGNTYSDTPSDYILVQGNADLQNGWVTPRMWTTQVTKKADAGDLIMSVRAPAGAMGKTAYDAVIGRGVAAIKGNEFIYQLLVKMDSDGYWKTLSCGSTFESLNSNNIQNANVLIPNTDEQEKIGNYFRSLDNLITLHQRKLEKLQKIKKSLLEEMFA